MALKGQYHPFHIRRDYIGTTVPTVKRYLANTDFPNSQWLYGYRPGAAAIMDTIYGGSNLSIGGTGYSSSTDHLGNTNNCFISAGYSNTNGTSNGNLSLHSIRNWSIFLLMYSADWANIDAEIFVLASPTVFKFAFATPSVIRVRYGVTAADASVAHGLTGSGWHSFAMTRNESSTETKIYVDGVLKVTGAAASNYGQPTYATFPIAGTDCRLQDVWIHANTIWPIEQIQVLHNLCL